MIIQSTLDLTDFGLNGHYKMPLCLAFDDTKAFDSLELPAVMQALERQAIHPTYVNLIKHICSNNFSFIRLHQDFTIFQLYKGIRQGDTISPKLFTACLEEIF